MGCFKLMGFHGTRFNSMWLWMTQSFLTSRSPLWRLWQPSSWQVINFDKDLPQLRTNFGSMTWNTHSYTPHFSVFVRCFPQWLLPHVFLFINQESDMFKGWPYAAPCSLWSACGWGISRPREGCLPAAVPSGSPLRCWCGSRRNFSVCITIYYNPMVVCVYYHLFWGVSVSVSHGIILYVSVCPLYHHNMTAAATSSPASSPRPAVTCPFAQMEAPWSGAWYDPGEDEGGSVPLRQGRVGWWCHVK